MGGRGSASGLSGGGGALDQNAKTVTISTYYRRSGHYFGENVYQIREEAPGHITIGRAQPYFVGNNSKANTQDVEYYIKHGAELYGKGNVEWHGVNWNKVKSVSGQTYDLKHDIKSKGFRWNSENKSWVRKDE